MKSTCLGDADLHSPECLSQLTSVEPAGLDITDLDIEPLEPHETSHHCMYLQYE